MSSIVVHLLFLKCAIEAVDFISAISTKLDMKKNNNTKRVLKNKKNEVLQMETKKVIIFLRKEEVHNSVVESSFL